MRIFCLIFLLISLSLTGSEHIFIGISGGTASGKTTLSKRIKSEFGDDVVLIEQDCYYHDMSHLPLAERRKSNVDHPDAIDFTLLCEHLRALQENRVIAKPRYSFAEYSRLPEATIMEPKKVVVVEGILLLAIPEVRNLLDLKVFIDTDDDIRILRRIERDINERGRDLSIVKKQYLSTVKPMHDSFVEPSKRHADVIIPGNGKTKAAVDLLLAKIRESMN